MGTPVRLLDTTDQGWDAVLRRVPHDSYHARGYARACETHESDRVQLAIVESDAEVLVVPVIARELPSDLRGATGLSDITAPYGYPAPVCTSADPAVQAALLGSLFEGLRDRGFVSAFLRCNPFVGLAEQVLSSEAHVVSHGELVILEPQDLPEDATVAFRADHRRGIRILRDKGFLLRVDDAQHTAAFPQLYRERMLAVGADPYYLFPDAYFETLFAELGEGSRLISVVDDSGRLAAAAIVLVCGRLAHYHLSSTHEAFLREAPMKLAVLGMIELCRDEGVELLNLGSGLGGRHDSLFEFKAGFSAARARFESARVILDRNVYRELSGGDDDGGFFPAYRCGY